MNESIEQESFMFMLSGRGSGRWYYKMKLGLEKMYFIRAWCGCRQDIEPWEAKE